MKPISLIIVGLLVVLSVLHHAVDGAPTKKEKEKTKSKEHDSKATKLTDEERKFLKEVEEKFNIKSEDKETGLKNSKFFKIVGKKPFDVPFPAVVAIEIVNDTNADGKGKRTIDANLGYGYKTDNGYFYQQFGKSQEEKGKFMIYPYSQHDIPPINTGNENSGHTKYYSKVFTNREKGEKTFVEIQPSKAFQLIPIDSNEQYDSQHNFDSHGHRNTYNPNNIVSQLKTRYENVQAVETPPPPSYSPSEEYYSNPHTENPTILYSTYSGGHLSGLSGHFPVVMPNYYLNPSQILGHSQFLPNNEEHVPQRRVIPVLILKIPSSQIQHPVAEIYPKLPHSNPYVTAINNENIRALVNQYLENLQTYFLHSPVPYQQPSYVGHRQSVYSVPSNIENLHYPVTQSPEEQYVQSDYASYLQQSEYQQEHPSQNIQYVPHHSQAIKSHVPSAHMSFSQVYSNLRNSHQPQYEHQEDDGHTLQITENYPDNSHTRVILNPSYHNAEPEEHRGKFVSSQPIEYATPSTVDYESQLPVENDHDYGRIQGHESQQPSVKIVHHGHPMQEDEGSHKQQADSYGNVQDSHSSNTEESESKYESAPSTKTTKLPVNYHAHPYPKRQVKPADKETSKTTQRSRRLRSGVDTAVMTKL